MGKITANRALYVDVRHHVYHLDICIRTYIKTLPWPVKSLFEENIWRLISAITVLIMRGHPFHLLLCPPGIPINTKISQKLTFTLTQHLLSIIYIYKCVKMILELSHMTGVISPLTPLNIYFYSISRPGLISSYIISVNSYM